MRLLACNNRKHLSFTKDIIGDDEIPPYAILSHTWQKDQEVTFNEMLKRSATKKSGYKKIEFCAKQAQLDDLQYFWVDTCCINKADHIELQDAINSMFRWYRDAEQCYVYLWDVSAKNVSSKEWEKEFRKSRWFTRGWTLQELLAPSRVKFYSKDGVYLGDKQSLEQQIHEITGIPIAALHTTPLLSFSIEERMSWFGDRQTTRSEDRAYSLLGIFGVYMLPNYGEGYEYAFKRLRREIKQLSQDTLQQQASSQSVITASQLEGEGTVQAPWLVPFPRPRSFVGRKIQLARLAAHVSSADGQRLAIYGLGGCGKTALTLETVYRTREVEPTRAIFWVPAVTRAGFEQVYQDIAALLQIPLRTDGRHDVLQQVKMKLSEDMCEPWLMIVDNADDVGLLLEPFDEGTSAQRLIDYLPRGATGSIVFTTRTREAALKLAENNLLSLGALDNVEAAELLKIRLLPEHHAELKDKETVGDLLKMLFYHALAIVQAVAFVNTNDLTLADYIALYRQNESESINLLNEEYEDQGRYRETNNAVATTWYISFEQIRKVNQLAAHHLVFMACTANNDIPASMLAKSKSLVEQTKALGLLKAYAFIIERVPKLGEQTMHERVRRFDMHPLVHLTIRGWMKGQHQWDIWTERAMKRLTELIPYGNPNTREVWAAYLPHAKHVVDIYEACKSESRMTLLERLGECERMLGRYAAAEQTYRQAIEQRERVSGRDHLDARTGRSQLAKCLLHMRRGEEAERILRKELTSDDPALTTAHKQLKLTNMHNLAAALRQQGKTIEADEIDRQTRVLTEDTFGTEHELTLSSQRSLAFTLRKEGKHAEAANLLRHILETSKRTLGPEDTDTLFTMRELGLLLFDQEDYTEASQFQHDELRLREKYLGETHPSIPSCVYNLGATLSRQSKLVQAESLHRQSLVRHQALLAKDNPVLLDTMAGFARCLDAHGKVPEAELLHREVLSVREKALPRGHVDTTWSVYWLAGALDALGRYDEALELYERALEGFKVVFGEEHANTVGCRNVLEVMKEKVESRAGGGKEEGEETQAGAEETGESGREVAIKSKRRRWRDLTKWKREKE
ncbi:kinesin light chain 1 [Paraphoma chrysanthemicola]|nr:kinesin light chain 1 [Paraphoma chrysanthemicola]